MTSSAKLIIKSSSKFRIKPYLIAFLISLLNIYPRPTFSGITPSPIKNVADRATLWIIRDHKKHGSKTARELGKDYQPFFSDVRVKVINRISDKPEKEPAEVDSGNY